MMFNILILLTALIFYALGYFAGHYGDIKISAIKRKLMPKKGAVIDYITPEKSEYYGSEREKIDQQQEKLLREAGL